MTKAIILDFDGIIIDSEQAAYEACKIWFMKNYNFELSLEDHISCVGSNTRALAAHMNKKYEMNIDAKSLEDFVTKETIELNSKLPPMPGVIDLIKNVKNRGLLLGLCTSSKRDKIDFHLARLKIDHYFDQITTSDLITRLKPDPEIYLKAIEMLECKAEEVVVVEDSFNGVIAAKATGAYVVAIPNEITKHFDLSRADMIISSFNDFPNELLEGGRI